VTRLLLAGATWRERAGAALGAAIATALAGDVAGLLAGEHAALLLIAPIGASAVLLFCVPSSPLGQPWPVIGGTVVSLLCSVLAARTLGHGALAAGAAVGLSIIAMSATRCLHPAGGGCALVAVLGPPEVLAKGYAFALVPGGLNAALLVLAGIAFHRFSRHSYPHRALVAAPLVAAEDIDAALAESGETFDIARDDIIALFDAAERHAAARKAAGR
jgi:CBS domain-containing membrane protein